MSGGSGVAQRRRSPAISGLRGLAAVGLLTIHVAMISGVLGTRAFGTERPPSNVAGAFFISGLPCFIGVLFVLPAMYLYLPVARAIIAGEPRPAQGANLMRRVLRLLPAYYVMCAVVLVTLNRGHLHDLWFVLRPFLLVQVYFPTPFRPTFVNGMEITWTVPSMLQWYAALPVIGWMVHRFAARGATPAARARRLMLPVPLLVGLGVGWLLVVKANGWDNRMVFWWPQGFAATIGIGMALGIMLALVQVSPADTPRLFRAVAAHPWACWLAAFVVYLVNCARPFSVIGMDAIYSTGGLLVTYLTVAAFGLLATLPLVVPGAPRLRPVEAVLANRPAVFLGQISYGIYLWHFAVMHYVLQPGSVLGEHVRPIRELYGTSGFVRLETATLAGSVLISVLSHYLVERPISAWADRRFRDVRPGEPRRLPAAGHAALAPSAAAPVLSRDEAMEALAKATTDRDAIQANLVDLDRNFGRRLLGDTELTGRTRVRWEAATADLTALWELFTAYSNVVDEAVRALDGGRRVGQAELGTVSGLLGGPSVEVTESPPPLAQRQITDRGLTRLTADAAIERMNTLFRRVVELVTTVEAVWSEATGRLEEIRSDLTRAREHGADDSEIASAETDLRRQITTLDTDPLDLWRDGRISSELDALRRRASSLVASAQDHTTDTQENS